MMLSAITGLVTLDWVIIGLYFLLSISIGIIMSKRAGKSTGDFFLSGRKLPWWIAGTSMVATTFAADTPLAVTELVAQNGIAGNWLWWNMVFGGVLTVFFFARLWRRSGIMTDCEFVAIRYSGPAAKFLRGFRAVYIGIVMNMIVIGWVNLAMVKILSVVFPDLTFFGIEQVHFLGFEFSAHLLAVACLMLFVAVYSSLSGLMGVSITDAFQFVMAMTGCIVLAVFALKSDMIGGLAGLREKLPEYVFRFTPEIGNAADETAGAAGLLKMSVTAFVAYLGVQWWASWYPGAEPGGGGYVAQRMMSAKNEKHSLFATLWFNVAHYAVRPWPWVIVALCSLVLFPELAAEDKGKGFVLVMMEVLPSGLIGLLLAAFLAAYMSTIASQTVWGTSYIVNDLFRPFVKPNADEKYYVLVSRITTFILMLLALILTSVLTTVSGAWKFILTCSGGIGLVLLLRWFWWRINAWSEIAAMVAPYLIYPFLVKWTFEEKVTWEDRFSYGVTLMVIVGFSTVVWLLVTYLTKPTDEAKLKEFYAKVHPGGPGWKSIAAQMPEVTSDTGYGALFVNWAAGCGLVLCALFGVGKLLFGEPVIGVVMLGVAGVCAGVIYFNLSQSDFSEEASE
ncbi:MAG: sodium:solute symporter family protein [Planctomycetota bacterium]|jgi:Na+/proline symporter